VDDLRVRSPRRADARVIAGRRGASLGALAAGLALTASACGGGSAAAPPVPPSHVVRSGGVTSVVLTPQAARRAGLETAPLRVVAVHHTQVVAGQLVAPPVGANFASRRSDGVPKGAVWLRIALPPTALARIDRRQDAQVLPTDAADVAAHPVHLAAGAASPASSALYYTLAAPRAGLGPGGRVRVEVPLAGSGARHKVIPYDALLYDASGGTWTYTTSRPLVFVRRRVKVDYVDGGAAVLAQGPPAGTRVVTVGAEELFGAETTFQEDS
jgi:hypothetical protein